MFECQLHYKHLDSYKVKHITNMCDFSLSKINIGFLIITLF